MFNSTFVVHFYHNSLLLSIQNHEVSLMIPESFFISFDV